MARKKNGKTRRGSRPRRRTPSVATPKFAIGDRVILDFWKGGPVSGFTKKQCQRAGFIEMHKGRFMRTPGLAQIDYVVRLDEPFCQLERYVTMESTLSAEEASHE